ncbi:hypothetical protein T492DRAFT_842550 [Pavlovales sp. CCMP2436]|nr:hypothetical protein T492DRAFT_842550 [Pavlovales sp. CCMP2436]
MAALCACVCGVESSRLAKTSRLGFTGSKSVSTEREFKGGAGGEFESGGPAKAPPPPPPPPCLPNRGERGVPESRAERTAAAATTAAVAPTAAPAAKAANYYW